MLGPIVNALTVVVCSLLGCFMVRGIPPRFEEIIKKSLGLVIVYIGVRGAMENQRVLLLIMSMVIGAVVGESIDIDGLMNRLGRWTENRLFLKNKTRTQRRNRENEERFVKGFASASILFCSGSMTIVGSMQSGLQGVHETLFAKSILDGTISLVFGASMGIGVAFSAVTVFVCEGGIALAAGAIKGLLTQEVVTEMSAVGSLIIAAIGFNFFEIKEIRVANLTPAIFVPWVWLMAADALQRLQG
ncbi:MAG: DUF554 domain-containing protein [Treponema sp.]|jgi:uncharacterized membrane protein YqgA involved in biofilm formation|nr:DUF554 domain-containing protein [Treponema sp.]